MKLACATDNEREGNKVSMGVILAEIQSSEIWTVKTPHPAARQDPQWRVKGTNRTNIISTQICPVYKKCRQKDGAENEGMAKLYPAQLETHPIGKQQSLTLLRKYFLYVKRSA